MKRILAIVLVLVMAIFFSACNNEKTHNKSAKKTHNDSSKESQIASFDKQTVQDEGDSNPKNSFSPKVIASRCTHNYNPPSCTSLVSCTICGELLTGLYEGKPIEYGHSYQNKKCVDCGFELKGLVEISGNYFGVNQPITVDVSLNTNQQEISVYPCVALYKYVNNKWEPYNGMYDLGEFFALEATYGEELVSNGVKYGRWDYMSNEIIKTNSQAIVEDDFTGSRLIRRFKLSIPEEGEYKIEITDGPDNSKKPSVMNHSYVLKIY